MRINHGAGVLVGLALGRGPGQAERLHYVALLGARAISRAFPMACHACASPTLTEKGLKWFWRTGPNDKVIVASVFLFLREWREHGGPTASPGLLLLADRTGPGLRGFRVHVSVRRSGWGESTSYINPGPANLRQPLS
jgi:hypothetical protein